MTNQITMGEIDQKWSSYGIEQLPIFLNGEDTTNRILAKDNEFVGIVGKHYRVLPNELALELADESAKLSELVPFTDINTHDMGYRGMTFFDGHNNAIKNKWKLHAFYTTNRATEIGGEKVNIGVAVHNSIDGSMGFNVGVFTYRMICSNMVMAGFKDINRGMLGKTLEYLYGRHTDSLTHIVSNLKEKMVTVMEKAHLIVDSYEGMSRQRATEELIKNLRDSRISDKILPEYCKAEELEVSDLSEWDVYNDITEAIWHSDRTNMDTKQTYMDQLHRVMPIVPQRRRI